MANYVELTKELLEAHALVPVTDAVDYTVDSVLVQVPLELSVLKNREGTGAVSLVEHTRGLLDKYKLFMDEHDVVKIVIGLIQGNVILYGPPGTGKTALIALLAELFKIKVNQIWTANAEWTTYDVIGGLAPAVKDGQEVVTGRLGKITQDMVDCCVSVRNHTGQPDTDQATWSVIDEMNRCDIDKAFGDLFTALGSGDFETRKVQLPFMENPKQRTIYVPGRFRLIGTINTYDKDYIQDFSLALARRFKFYSVDIPPLAKTGAELDLLWEKVGESIIRSLSSWGVKDTDLSALKQAFANLGVWDWFTDLIKFIRWEQLKRPVGSAQISEVFKSVITQIIALDTLGEIVAESEDGKRELVATFDQAFSEIMVSQIDSSRDLDQLRNWLLTHSKCPFQANGPTIRALDSASHGGVI